MTTPIFAAVDAADFRAAIRAVASIVEKRTTIPILGTIKLTFGGGRMVASSTDLDIALDYRIPAQAFMDASICVSMATLVRIADFATSTIGFEVAKDRVTMQAGMMRVAVSQLYPAEDWPTTPVSEGLNIEASPMVVSEPEMRLWWDYVTSFISNEETRYYLNGVHICAEHDGRMRVEATDGHRLCRYSPMDAKWRFPEVILPKKAVAKLRALLRPSGNREIKMVATETKAMIGGDITMVTKVIDGKYPDTARVIPRNDTVNVTIDLNREAMRGFPTGRPGRSCAIKFDPENGGKMVTSIIDDGVTIETPLPVVADEPMGFNARYLRDILAMPRCGSVRMKASSSNDPAIVHTEDPDLLVVLMPMRV